MNVNWLRFDCRRARKLARLLVAGCATESERVWLSEHTGTCADCRYYAAELSSLTQELKAWQTSVAKPAVTPELSAQWQMAIRAEARRTAELVPPAAQGRVTPTWLGIDRAVPASLVLVWLVTIGIHLNTPAVDLDSSIVSVPTLREVRVVMEWLIAEKDAV